MKKTLSIMMIALAMYSCDDDEKEGDKDSGSDSPVARITEVTPAEDKIVIKNLGTGSIDISSYWLCTEASIYTQISDLQATSGDPVLNAGESITVTFAVDDNSADASLYNSNSFTSSSALLDFVQWGSGGQGRESVAVQKGIWTAGEFVAAPTTNITFTGTKTDFGQSFWSSN